MWGSYGRVTLPTATSASAVYNLANRPTSWNGQAVTHDADGNLTALGAQTFTWNARGQLTATSAGNLGYGYDGLGRRSTRSVSGTPNARYLYDGLNLVQEQNGTGTVLANTLTGPGLDQVYRRTEAAGNRNFLTDAQGSVIALSDGAATPSVPTSYTYAPYGAQTTTGTASTNPFGFTGREADQTSGLQYNRARYLSPGMGRFISEDPIEIAGGMSVYSYAQAAPTVLVDPLGLDPSAGLVRLLNLFGAAAGLVGLIWPPAAAVSFGLSTLSTMVTCASGSGNCADAVATTLLVGGFFFVGYLGSTGFISLHGVSEGGYVTGSLLLYELGLQDAGLEPPR